MYNAQQREFGQDSALCDFLILGGVISCGVQESYVQGIYVFFWGGDNIWSAGNQIQAG